MQKIKVHDLIPGDLILCHGKGFISNTIMIMEEANYSHSAIYYGDGQIMHAYPPELCITSIDFLFKEEKFLDAFRLIKDGKEFGSPDFSADNVLKVGEQYVAKKEQYAMSHLYLLALVAFTRDIPMPLNDKLKIRERVDNKMQQLFNKIDKGKLPMVCSEFVYRCYAEADSTGKYTPEIEFGSNKKNKIKEAFADLETMDNFHEIRQLLFKMELMDKRHGEELKDVVPSCVSPKDLFLSPNFIPLGRIEK